MTEASLSSKPLCSGPVAMLAPMRFMGRTQRRVVAAILLTALIPLASSVLLARGVIGQITEIAFHPEFGTAIDQALFVYADLVKSIKQSMRNEAEAISLSPELRRAAESDEPGELTGRLAEIVKARESVAALEVTDDEGTILASANREKPVDPQTERTLTVTKPLNPEGTRLLAATFATPSARFAEQESLQSFAQAYRQVESRNRTAILDNTFTQAAAVVLVLTILLAVVIGVFVVRPVTRGIAALASATKPVAAGDLSVRVDISGWDEVADLGTAFNSMLAELEESRARVEFLRRMGEWQKVARRLAHEIKNPLTPIQLAVEECHRRYSGDDATYQQVVQTTLEVVQEEVGSLRRLVTQFSNFARLPQAELEEADLSEFMREQSERWQTRQSETDSAEVADTGLFGHRVEFRVPDEQMPVSLDREMMHRVLNNLITNGAQAMRDAQTKNDEVAGTIEVTLSRAGDTYRIDVDDDGPGVPPNLRATMFDPYVTTKSDGTGLGLSIVKKIVVDHGGKIEVCDAPSGGARMRIRIPVAGSVQARVADEAEPQSKR